MFQLVIVFLMFQMQHVKLLFCLFDLIFESGNLLLVRLFALLKFDLEQCQLLHSLLYSLFVLVEHAVGRSILWLKRFVYILEFNDFFLEIFKPLFKVVSFSFDQFELFFQYGRLVFLSLLEDRQQYTLKVSISCWRLLILALSSSFYFSRSAIRRVVYS